MYVQTDINLSSDIKTLLDVLVNKAGLVFFENVELILFSIQYHFRFDVC